MTTFGLTASLDTFGMLILRSRLLQLMTSPFNLLRRLANLQSLLFTHQFRSATLLLSWLHLLFQWTPLTLILLKTRRQWFSSGIFRPSLSKHQSHLLSPSFALSFIRTLSYTIARTVFASSRVQWTNTSQYLTLSAHNSGNFSHSTPSSLTPPRVSFEAYHHQHRRQISVRP